MYYVIESWCAMSELISELGIVDTFFKLLLALICGGILGIDRGRKNRPAGFRTYMLVCVASAIVMITNEYITTKYGGDPSRMGAQVISGIGFLGAGTIIVTGRNRVKGLTTAAGLWASACIGLTIGIGYYSGAIVGCLMIFVAMELLHGLEKNLMYKTKEITLYVEFSSITDIGKFIKSIKINGLKVSDMELIKSNNINEPIVGGIFTITSPKMTSYDHVIEILRKSEGICTIEEV
ncbi:MgtC/SapB transporter [Clostridium disporicum]|uniref:MgtC/SapB transporter n=1 Tax=Clostridium disporicum TaxID=84024 RepID=A0A174DA87_9CLOT|nr:MgtC/SapB transporter [Clostridium disporicum]